MFLFDIHLLDEIVHNLRELINNLNGHEMFDLGQRGIFVSQVIEGLRYLHKSGIVHSDLKPTNMLVNGKSESSIIVKQADFAEMALLKSTVMTMTANSLKDILAILTVIFSITHALFISITLSFYERCKKSFERRSTSCIEIELLLFSLLENQDKMSNLPYHTLYFRNNSSLHCPWISILKGFKNVTRNGCVCTWNVHL